MGKIVLFIIVLLLLFLLLGTVAKGQTFDPVAVNDDFPAGIDLNVNNNIGSSLSIVCTSCATNLVSETFRVSAAVDGSDLDNAYFEWVIFGGTITGYSGIAQSNPGSYFVGSSHRQYIQTQGVDGVESWITVEMDTHLPDTVWIAVRQTSEFGCSDDQWAVWLMKKDDIDPAINFIYSDVWTDSLVVVAPPSESPIAVDLSNFTDSVHFNGSSSVVNIFPSVTDNCSTVDLSFTVNGAATSFNQDYGYGEYALQSTATD